MLNHKELLLALNKLESIVMVTDINGRIRFVNDAFTDKYGYTHEEITGKNPGILKTDYHDIYFYKELWSTILNGETWQGIFRNKTKYGKLIWENARISPIIKDNQIEGFIAIKEDVTSKKELEEQLYKEKFLLDELFDNAPVGVILFNPIYAADVIDDLIVLKANPIAAGIFNKLGIVGLTLKRFLLDYHYTLKKANEMLSSKLSYEQFCSDLKKHLQIRTFPIGDKRICMYINDVTEYKKNIDALEKSEQRYSSLVEDSPALIRRFNKKGKISYVNKYYSDYYNESPSYFTGKNIFNLLNNEGAELVKKNLMKLTPSQPFVEYQQQIHLTNGTARWQKWIDRALFDSKGKIVEYQSVGMDFTRLKETEIQLETQKNKLNAIFNNSLMGIGIIDYKGYFKMVNPKLKDMFKYTDIDINSINYFNHIKESDSSEIQSNFNNLFDGKVRTFHTQRKYVRKDGSDFWADLFAAPISYKDGKPSELLGMIIDITERHKIEEELKASELKLKHLNHTKDKLFSVIAHDIRNPFNAIIGFSNILNNNLDNFSAAEVKEFISRIVEASEQTYKLLEDLLTWAKSQLGQLKVNRVLYSPDQIVEECVESLRSLAANKNIKIQKIISTHDKIKVDVEMLKFVIRNLLHNGIKFSHPNSRIRCIIIKNGENTIVIKVIDEGVGIRPEKLDILFKLDEFLSTCGTSLEKGTGLGLSLSKEMIELNKGVIEVFSEVNKGSEFRITLPGT